MSLLPPPPEHKTHVRTPWCAFVSCCNGVLPVGLCPDNPNGDEAMQTSRTLIVFVLECNYPNVEGRYNPYKTTENNGKTV